MRDTKRDGLFAENFYDEIAKMHIFLAALGGIADLTMAGKCLRIFLVA